LFGSTQLTLVFPRNFLLLALASAPHEHRRDRHLAEPPSAGSRRESLNREPRFRAIVYR
jgi:hypothetical protein